MHVVYPTLEKFMQTSKHVTLVCGGNGRIGKQICKSLYQAGHYIIVWDVHDEPTHEMVDDYVQIDLTNEDAVKSMVQTVSKELEMYDIFTYINVSYPSKWRDHFSAFLIPTCAFVEEMCGRENTSIILFSSIYGHMIPRFDIYFDSNVPEPPIWYGMVKASIEYMTKYLAKKYPGIRINCIAPGGVLDMSLQDDEFIVNYECHADLLDASALNRTIMYLLDESNITGQVITVDDGFSL
jgi:NAD(P)-dependent dehydrogenase (short-subunit alcohol dehydrogenase family)